MTRAETAEDNSHCRGGFIGDLRPLSGLRVCYFGRYDPRYSRNVIISKCLERAGAEVVRIRDDRSLPWRTPSLLRRAVGARFQLLIVGFRAHSDMLTAGLVAGLKRVPLIFDPLTSRYEERVIDRRLVSDRSWLARWYSLTDKTGCQVADRVLLETDAQIAFFVQAFGLPRSKCRRVWLGADDEVMKPAAEPAPRETLRVFFYGRFSPLHGVEHIVRAATLLEARGSRVRFTFVGSGQTYESVRTLAAQVGLSTATFVEPVPYPVLAAMMADADVCLGSFGTTARAGRVIPYKVFDALAVGRAVITADTPAVREAVTHGQHAWLCPAGDAEALADAIERLARDVDLRRSLAANGHRLFKERFSLDAMTHDLAEMIGQLIP